MKLVTAEEARKLSQEAASQDAVDRLIEAVNKRVRSRARSGELTIGMGDDYGPLHACSEIELEQVIQGLRDAGYLVTMNHPCAPYFTLSWKVEL